MATPRANLRIIAELFQDVGEASDQRIDTDAMPIPLPILDDCTERSIRYITLGPAVEDQALSFTDAVGLVIVSLDYPFSLRVAAAETLLENMRAFVLWADDTDDGIHQTSVLLTGNSLNEANLAVITLEKP